MKPLAAWGCVSGSSDPGRAYAGLAPPGAVGAKWGGAGQRLILARAVQWPDARLIDSARLPMQSPLIRILVIMLLVWLTAGCRSTDQGVCQAPNDHIEWFYIEETNLMWTEEKCIHCDTSISEDELQAWAEAQTASHTGTSQPYNGQPTPCTYTYGDDTNAEECAAIICGDDPPTGDVVDKEHGAWKVIEPVLSGDALLLAQPGGQPIGTTTLLGSTLLPDEPPPPSQPVDALLDEAFYGAASTNR